MVVVLLFSHLIFLDCYVKSEQTILLLPLRVLNNFKFILKGDVEFLLIMSLEEALKS